MDLSSVFQLIERLDVEVRGLQSSSASRDRQALLKRFVAGELDAAKRKEICGWLRQEPELIAWVASEVKERRKVNASS